MRLPIVFLLTALFALNLRAETAGLTLTLTSQEGPLEDAVASLTSLDFDPPPLDRAEAEIVQDNKEYEPYVTVIRAGTVVRFPNRDSVQHHIYSVSKPKRFELPLYASGESKTEVFERTGVVTLGCNIHDWMIAYVVVMHTPWFTKTKFDGIARLDGIPPGRYRLEVWHPRLSRAFTREITLAAGENPGEALTFKLKPDRRIRRAPTGSTGGY